MDNPCLKRLFLSRLMRGEARSGCRIKSARNGVDRQKDGGRCGGWQSRKSHEVRESFIAVRRGTFTNRLATGD